MSKFQIGDYVESEYFSSVGLVLGTSEVSVYVNNGKINNWYLDNQVELVNRIYQNDTIVPKLKGDQPSSAYLYNEKLKTEQPIKQTINEMLKEQKLEGRKDDQEKPDLSLLPREFLEEVAKAFMHGEKKYGRYNYRAGLNWHRLIAAAMRHITAFNEGENMDVESGHSHLGHAGACIAMLLVYQQNTLGKDTRYKK